MKVTLERLKASQSAAGYDPEDLPGALADATAAMRMGKTPKSDQALRNVKNTEEILELKTGQLLAVVGKSEVQWAKDYHRRKSHKTTLTELLSYARQVVVAGKNGRLLVRHAGHPGDGPHMPLLGDAPEDLTVSVQPGDLLLRFDQPKLDALDLTE